MSEVKFYRCNHCGNIVSVVNEGTCTPKCCGEPMELLRAGSTDAATEKHVPQVTREGDQLTANVGSVDHPMLEEHYIQWIAVAYADSVSLTKLHPGDKPRASFTVPAGEPATVYEYCNLHGLWKVEA